LFKYELPLIGRSCSAMHRLPGTEKSECNLEIYVLDFKTDCNEDMLKKMQAQMHVHDVLRNGSKQREYDQQKTTWKAPNARITCESPSDSYSNAFSEWAELIESCEVGDCNHIRTEWRPENEAFEQRHRKGRQVNFYQRLPRLPFESSLFKSLNKKDLASEILVNGESSVVTVDFLFNDHRVSFGFDLKNDDLGKVAKKVWTEQFKQAEDEVSLILEIFDKIVEACALKLSREAPADFNFKTNSEWEVLLSWTKEWYMAYESPNTAGSAGEKGDK